MNKISKVQLNGQQYSLKGDADNIKDVMAKEIQDIYSEIESGTDSETVEQILQSLTNLQNDKADKSELSDIWNSINSLRDQIPESTINYYFAYKVSTEIPERPDNDQVYVPQGWSSQPTIPTLDEVLYMTMARTVNGEWLNWGDYRWTLPIAYNEKQTEAFNIESTIALYKLSQDTPTLSDIQRRTATYPEGWTTTPNFAVQEGKEVYMITAKTINGQYVLQGGYYWSAPMRIGGGTTSTTGTDGDSYNYVYCPSNRSTAPSTPTFTVSQIEEQDHIGNWYDSPQGVSENRMYEYISLSVGNDKSRNNWTSPVLWSKWGERGMDGDSVEYIYKLHDVEVNNPINLLPSYSQEFVDSDTYQADDFLPSDWTDDPSGVNSSFPYEYVAVRKKTNGVWSRFSTPALWAKYGKDGQTGNQGISGAVIRYRGKWTDILDFNGVSRKLATFECNSNSEGGNIRYIDVVYDGVNYYQCREQHTMQPGSSGPTLSNTRYWQVAEQFKFIVTETLIADYISTHTVSANDVIIKEGEGQNMSIVAGMTSSTAKHSTLGDVRIWAGTSSEDQNIQNAPFIVNNKGELYASNANIWGRINATSGSFSGDIQASSLAIMDGNQIVMQFMPAPSGIEGIPQGTPALFMFYNGQSYVVNMTQMNSQSGVVTTYTSRPYYVVNSGQESNMAQKLRQCHTVNGKLYYSQGVKMHNDPSINLTVLHQYYLCSSNNVEINNKVFISDNSNQPFSGICIDANIYNEFTRDYNAASNTGTYRAFYQIWIYTDGVKSQYPGKIEIGSWHTTTGAIDRSDFQDIGLTQPYTAPALYSNYTRPISYSELSAQMQISSGQAPNPGQID